jgi:hypothetical protein
MSTSLYCNCIRPWERPLTPNEQFWIEVIRLASHDSDPAPTLAKVQALRRIFSRPCGAGVRRPEDPA